MTMPSTLDWINEALTGNDGVWQIGQIDDLTARALNKLVKQGALCKSRGRFCGISPLKTIWHRPGLGFSIVECVEFVEAHGEALAKHEEAYANWCAA